MISTTPFSDTDYLDFFGLQFHPFPVAPDDENFYTSQSIEQIVTEIVHGMMTRKGFMILTGEVGLGKTTISRKIMRIMEERGIETSLLFQTTYQDVEIIKEINRDFGLAVDDAACPTDHIRRLNSFLLEQNKHGKNCVIIIDDAQNLDHYSFELIRMISNLEADRKKLVQILLIGQPELLDKLSSVELRQLRSRIVIHKDVRPLNRPELRDYLQFKLTVSGNKGQATLENSACKLIYKLSKGNLRHINILMDRCLYAACLNHTRRISSAVVRQAHTDLIPEIHRRYWHKNSAWLSIAAGGLLVFSLAAVYGVGSFKSSTKEMLRSLPKMVSAYHAPSIALLTDKTDQLMPHAVENETMPPTEARRSGNKLEMQDHDPVRHFLKDYGLQAYVSDFKSALDSNELDAIIETIYKEKGKILICLDSVPQYIRPHYGILSYPMESDGKDLFFLFWNPVVRITRFFYGYQGDEIRVLQRLLAQNGLYRYRQDGIVGKKNMLAVTAFQERMGLTKTGYPDDITIFLLSHPKKGFRYDG